MDDDLYAPAVGFAGIVVGVGISLLVAVVFITVVCIVMQRSQAFKATG